jgi:hypothetical protein
MLKPQDIVVLVRLTQRGSARITYQSLGAALGMSASEAHAAVRRATASGLLDRSRTPRNASLLEFLVHGLKYTFPAEWKGMTRGIPTSIGAPPLRSRFDSTEFPPVWPHPNGTARGEGLVPLYRSAPDAALRDAVLYEWLALVDAVRSGRARERQMAVAELNRRLS